MNDAEAPASPASRPAILPVLDHESAARQHGVGRTERQIGISQIGAEELVVVLDSRAQEKRPHAVQAQPKAREVPRPFVIEALLAGAGFRLTRVVRTDAPIGLVEAVPV